MTVHIAITEQHDTDLPQTNTMSCLLFPPVFPQTLALHNTGEGLWSGDRRTSPWKNSQVSWQFYWGMMLGKGERLDRMCVCTVLECWSSASLGIKELSLALRQHHCPCCYGNLFPVCLAARHIDSGAWTRRGIADFSVYLLKKYAITLLSSYYLCNLYEIVYKTPMLKQIKAHSELSGRPGNKIWIDLDSVLLPYVPDCSLGLLMELLLGIKTAWGLEAELQ